MSQTAYEPVPAVEPAEPRPSAGTVVMKFGGTSVGDVERLLDVARRIVAAREAGNRVVGVLSAMGDQTDELLDLAHRISDRPKPRALDMLVSVGERITCSLAEMAIEDFGHPAISLTGSQAGIVTDTVHGKAKIVEIRAHRIHDALDENHIVLVAGFQGVSTDYEVTTLGRGGSDMTAVALAAALGAEACEIYTDVEGVFTADPRVVPEARKLHAVSYEEMLEMAASGAKVLQLRSVEFARNHGVKVHVRSTFSDEDGTWIAEEDDRMLEKAMISGVTHTREESLYTVGGIGAGRLFGALADASVNVDTIVRTGEDIVFSAPDEDHGAIATTLDGLDGVTWSVRDDLGKVSVIGAGMKSHPGVAARTFATLSDLGLDAPVVTTSPIKIACYVARDEVERAVAALHHAFELDTPVAEWSLPRLGIVGATGAVGSVTLRLLAERGFDDVRPFASVRSAGTTVAYRDRELTVEEATPAALAEAGLDLCFFSVGTGPSSQLVPPTAERGTTCIDKSDAFRLTDGIPLVVAGVNDEALDDGRIVANPNCSAIQLSCVLKPILDAAGLVRVRLATYQSMSGAGDGGIERLRATEPMQADLAMDWALEGEEFDEEYKLRAETRKILGLSGLPLQATCVRVPVLVGHGQAIWVETEDRLSPIRPASCWRSRRTWRWPTFLLPATLQGATRCSSVASAATPPSPTASRCGR